MPFLSKWTYAAAAVVVVAVCPEELKNALGNICPGRFASNLDVVVDGLSDKLHVLCRREGAFLLNRALTFVSDAHDWILLRVLPMTLDLLCGYASKLLSNMAAEHAHSVIKSFTGVTYSALEFVDACAQAIHDLFVFFAYIWMHESTFLKPLLVQMRPVLAESLVYLLGLLLAYELYLLLCGILFPVAAAAPEE